MHAFILKVSMYRALGRVEERQDHKQSVYSVLPFCKREGSRIPKVGYYSSVPEAVGLRMHAS